MAKLSHCNYGELLIPNEKIRIMGQELKMSFEGLPNACDISTKMNGMLMPVITPVMAIVKIIECVTTLIEAIKSIPDAISSLDIREPADLIQEAIECFVGQVVSFLPQFWVIQFTIDIVVIVIRMIDCLITLLRKFVAFNSEYSSTGSIAEEVSSKPLWDIFKCGEDDIVHSEAIMMSGMLQPISVVLEILNLFYQMLEDIVGKDSIMNLLDYDGDPDDFYLPFTLDMSSFTEGRGIMLPLEYLESFKRDALIPLVNAFISAGLA